MGNINAVQQRIYFPSFLDIYISIYIYIYIEYHSENIKPFSLPVYADMWPKTNQKMLTMNSTAILYVLILHVVKHYLLGMSALGMTFSST